MRISFEKYHGTGNDFIMVDIRNHAIPEDADRIARLCHRRYGVGADGLIMLGRSESYDFSMRYFNADGREGSMCGNGGRCITAFAHQLGFILNETAFEAIDGPHKASILSHSDNNYQVRLQMADVKISAWTGDEIFLDTGSPHLVKQCRNINDIDINKLGKQIRNEKRFSPEGTNVNFIEEKDGKLFIRTYERGVEAETLSCGTGVTASALAWALRKQIPGPVSLQTMGGTLLVHFSQLTDIFTDIYLEGPAIRSFSGDIEI